MHVNELPSTEELVKECATGCVEFNNLIGEEAERVISSVGVRLGMTIRALDNDAQIWDEPRPDLASSLLVSLERLRLPAYYTELTQRILEDVIATHIPALRDLLSGQLDKSKTPDTHLAI